MEEPNVYSLGLIIFLLAMITVGCGGPSGVDIEPVDELAPEPIDIPGEGSWQQFHADAANHGVYFVESDFAYKPKWSIDVGHMALSSPVIDGYHTIYVGNLDGELIAIHRFGIEKWRLNLGEPVSATPAVSISGRVYVVTTRAIDDGTYVSTLHTVSATGTLIRSLPLPDNARTTSSPKLWRSEDNEYVFLFARPQHALPSALLIYDVFGDLVVNKKFSGCPIEGGSSIWDTLGDIISLYGDLFDSWPPGLDFDESGIDFKLYDKVGWLDPTVAIVDAPIFSEDPIVVWSDNLCFTGAYRWQPPNLTKLWSKTDKQDSLSSPASIRGTRTVVFGAHTGDVIAYDLLTGDRLWKTKVQGGAVMGTPVSRGIGTPIYVLSHEGMLTALKHSDGDELNRISIEGDSIASLALSANLIYANTTKGLASISFDFESWAGTGHASGGGIASPAIGPDGTLYTIIITDDSAMLQAYGGNQILAPEDVFSE